MRFSSTTSTKAGMSYGNFKNQRFLQPSHKATPWRATSLGMAKGKKKMPDVDLANRHPALQSMYSRD
jgi:hypothetical protein